MLFYDVMGKKVFPHVLVTLQWVFLIICIAFNTNFLIIVPGTKANGGLKVIMLPHLLMLFLPVVSCLMLYRIRDKGTAERGAIGLSMLTILFSSLNISLRFVDDFVLLMNIVEVVTWSLYNAIVSVSLYKILVGFLLPVQRRFAKVEKEAVQNDRELRL